MIVFDACAMIALANRVDCEVLTSDHHEFDPLVSLQVCKVKFIR